LNRRERRVPNGGIFKQIFDDLFALIFELIELKRALGPHPPFPLFAPVTDPECGARNPFERSHSQVGRPRTVVCTDGCNRKTSRIWGRSQSIQRTPHPHSFQNRVQVSRPRRSPWALVNFSSQPSNIANAGASRCRTSLEASRILKARLSCG
jgi:hypothetical protein